MDRDTAKRYLVPVGPLSLPGDPNDIHLSVLVWNPRAEAWIHGQGICGRSTTQGELPTGTTATCPDCLRRQADYELAVNSDPQELQQAYTAVFKQLPRPAAAELLAVMARDPQVVPRAPIMLAAALVVAGHGLGWLTVPPGEGK